MTDPIDVTIIGERIIYTWGEAVAERLNLDIVLSLAADEATNSATVSNITGLSFPCVSGVEYRWDLTLWYQCDTTSQGPSVGFRHPGGSAVSTARQFGITGDTTETIARVVESVANTDEMTASATVNTADLVYQIEWRGLYDCTADGTFQFRKALNGTPSGYGFRLFGGSGGRVVVVG